MFWFFLNFEPCIFEKEQWVLTYSNYLCRVPLHKAAKEASHLFPMSLKANEWTVLQVTLLGKRRCASLATDLLKATYRKRRYGRCLAYSTNVVVLPVPVWDTKKK